MTNIGFIGLGIMGRPMAGHLIKGGHVLFLHSRSGVPDELCKLGGRACATPSEVAHNAGIIITMLPDAQDVEQVLFGENGVEQGLSAGLSAGLSTSSSTGSSISSSIGSSANASSGKIVMDMSSISPIETRKFAARIGQLGCDYVDAPVSGGDIGARNATLTIMVGASQTVFERVRPFLELGAGGARRTHDQACLRAGISR